MALDEKSETDLSTALTVIGSSCRMLIEDNVDPRAVCGALLSILNRNLNRIDDEAYRNRLRELYSESLATGDC